MSTRKQSPQTTTPKPTPVQQPQQQQQQPQPLAPVVYCPFCGHPWPTAVAGLKDCHSGESIAFCKGCRRRFKVSEASSSSTP